MDIALRPVHDSDLPVFFRQFNDPESLRMAAFTPEDPADRDRFDAKWAHIRSSPRSWRAPCWWTATWWAACPSTARRASAR